MIKLIDGLYADADDRCYRIGKLATDKKGKQTIIPEAYVSTPQGIANFLLKRGRLRAAQADGDLKSFIVGIKKSDARIEALMKEVFPE